MTATHPTAPAFIRLACHGCGRPAPLRAGPLGPVLDCGECRERREVQFGNRLPVCRVCRTGTDGRAAHEDCLRKKGWAA